VLEDPSEPINAPSPLDLPPQPTLLVHAGASVAPLEQSELAIWNFTEFEPPVPKDPRHKIELILTPPDRPVSNVLDTKEPKKEGAEEVVVKETIVPVIVPILLLAMAQKKYGVDADKPVIFSE